MSLEDIYRFYLRNYKHQEKFNCNDILNPFYINYKIGYNVKKKYTSSAFQSFQLNTNSFNLKSKIFDTYKGFLKFIKKLEPNSDIEFMYVYFIFKSKRNNYNETIKTIFIPIICGSYSNGRLSNSW